MTPLMNEEKMRIPLRCDKCCSRKYRTGGRVSTLAWTPTPSAGYFLQSPSIRHYRKKDYLCHLIFPYPALCLTPKSSTRCIQVVLANPLLLKNASVLRYHHYFVNFKIHYFDLFSLHNASALMWTTPSEKNSCFPWKIITNYALWARDMKKYVKDLDNSKRLHYWSNQGYVIVASPESWLIISMRHLVLMDH